ncbi:hypothetical protein [Pontibacter fetidus]|uniref:O-antigen ligase-like membrane protein n=1 Tax=Pontibacter fetidus TaxID=2700082 RepID=A0A6B2H9R1_9BACT|nr:hypothetical protein [Pontibacter fetidus]NDK57507.1 hypothetical protein [Pontibacter fetidus]
MTGLPLDKGSDLAIIFTIFIVCSRFKDVVRIVKNYFLIKWCVYLVGFLSIVAIYSLLVLEYPLVNVLQVYRPYLLLFSFAVFFAVPLRILMRVFHTIALITVFQSILFLLQIITGQTFLLSAAGSESFASGLVAGSDYIRFYNTPVFLTPVLFYFFFVFKFKSKFKHYFILLVLILTVLGPMHRSYMLVMVAVLFIYVLLQKSSKKKFVYSSLISITIFAVSFVPIINSRLTEGINDLETTWTGKLSLNSIDANENTTTYRIAHFMERLDYVLNKPLGLVFGIGLISDNSPLASKLNFSVGLVSEETGQTSQVDTGDLVWSPLILTIGVFGTIMYFLFYWKLMLYYYKHINISSYAIVGFLTILVAFFISMMGTEMISNTFRVMMLLLIVLVIKQQELTKLILEKNKLSKIQS